MRERWREKRRKHEGLIEKMRLWGLQALQGVLSQMFSSRMRISVAPEAGNRGSASRIKAGNSFYFPDLRYCLLRIIP